MKSFIIKGFMAFGTYISNTNPKLKHAVKHIISGVKLDYSIISPSDSLAFGGFEP